MAKVFLIFGNLWVRTQGFFKILQFFLDCLSLPSCSNLLWKQELLLEHKLIFLYTKVCFNRLCNMSYVLCPKSYILHHVHVLRPTSYALNPTSFVFLCPHNPILSNYILLRPATSCFLHLHPVTSCHILLCHAISCYVYFLHSLLAYIHLHPTTSCHVLCPTSHVLRPTYYVQLHLTT